MIRGTLGRLLGTGGDGRSGRLSYADAKESARSSDPEIRRAVALDPDAKPELLYFLARDVSPTVRAAVAAHPATPKQADLVLATDDVAEVRTLVAEKVTSQVHSLPHDDAAQLWQLTISILEALTRDDLTRVRQLVAETVRGLDRIPKTMAITLARDSEPVVAIPALGYPGGFLDEELVEIVRGAHDSSIVAAVAKRPNIGPAVAEAVIERGDEAPIAALLANRTAEIAPATLERVIQRSSAGSSWRGPAAARRQLNDRGAEQLSTHLSTSLRDRPDVAPPLGAKLHDRVAQGTDGSGIVLAGEVLEPEDDAPRRVRQLEANQALTEDVVIDALGSDMNFAVASLALRAGIADPVVHKIFGSHSAKGLVSLAWRAGYTMRLALQLQTRIGRLPPKARLTCGGDAWPLGTDEMAWQIEFYRTLVPGA